MVGLGARGTRDSPHDGDLYGALAVPFRKWEALARFLLEPKPLLDDELVSSVDDEVLRELPDSSISEVELRETILTKTFLSRETVTKWRQNRY